jgi:hypothetical protein
MSVFVKNKYLWFLILTLVGYGAFEYYRPKPLDWNATYRNKDKIPFGTQALFELLPEVFGSQEVTSLREPIYNHLTEAKLPRRSTYVFVNRSFEADRNDRRELLDYVKRGNDVFISAYYFPDTLLSTLGVKADLKDFSLRDTTLVMNFVNPAFKKSAGYVFAQDDGRNFFVVKRPEKVVVLARNARNEPIFLKVAYGKGTFFLHNLPLALTNYYVLGKTTSDFAFKSLSYLSVQPIFWDEYQKQGRFGDNEQSLLRYIMTQPALQWAYYLTLFGLLLFAIFAGKRTQRIIPIITPPANTSLEFVQNIGQMYFERGNHANIAQQKIKHLLAYIPSRFYLKTNQIDTDFLETLAQKSGLPQADINGMFAEIDKTQHAPRLSEYSLLRLNKMIEDFYAATR